MLMRAIVFCVATFIASSLSAAPASSPAATTRTPATQPADEPPDLSQYDLPTLRAITERLFGTLTEAKQRLAANDAEIAKLKKENAALTQKLDELAAEVNGQKELITDLRNRLETAATETKKSDEPTRTVAAAENDAVARQIRDQPVNFAELNENPASHLGKVFKLLGYASPTQYSSQAMFNDQDSPRQYLALTNAAGDEIYLSYSKSGNEKLTALLNGDRSRVPLRLEVIATGTKPDALFEGAIQKWEVLK